jgi:hypothetical protein
MKKLLLAASAAVVTVVACSSPDPIAPIFIDDDAGTASKKDAGEQLTCPSCAGCCNKGKCEPGTDNAACGINGGFCDVCGGAAKCTAGQCVLACDPSTCTGCCDAKGECQTGTTAAACGSGGVTCAACSGAQQCVGNQCIESSCKASCATGCCTTAGCQPGNTATACGTGGNACTSCGTLACVSGACNVDPTKKWTITVLSAVIPSQTKAGYAWDILGGLPDGKVRGYSGLTGTDKSTAAHTDTTKFVADTLTPVWTDGNVLFNSAGGVSSTELLGGKLRLDVFDDDVASDDYVGGCVQTLTAADFAGTLKDVKCPADTEVAVTIRYKITPK